MVFSLFQTRLKVMKTIPATRPFHPLEPGGNPPSPPTKQVSPSEDEISPPLVLNDRQKPHYDKLSREEALFTFIVLGSSPGGILDHQQEML